MYYYYYLFLLIYLFILFLSFYFFFLSIFLLSLFFLPLSSRHPLSLITLDVGQGRIRPPIAPARSLGPARPIASLGAAWVSPVRRAPAGSARADRTPPRHLLLHRPAKSSPQLPSTPWCSPRPEPPLICSLGWRDSLCDPHTRWSSLYDVIELWSSCHSSVPPLLSSF